MNILQGIDGILAMSMYTQLSPTTTLYLPVPVYYMYVTIANALCGKCYKSIMAYNTLYLIGIP